MILPLKIFGAGIVLIQMALNQSGNTADASLHDGVTATQNAWPNEATIKRKGRENMQLKF